MNLLPLRSIGAVSAFVAFALAGALSCSKSASVKAGSPEADEKARPTEISHEPCDISAKSSVKTDVNNDGRSDITRVMNGAREVCRAVDLNFDGKVDSFLYFDDGGKLRRRESDFDRDGVVDEIGYYRAGQIALKHRETNLDGKLDTWDKYTGGKLTHRERDSNADGKVDQWWEFPNPSDPDCPVVASDQDGDGRPDLRQDVCKERKEAEADFGYEGEDAGGAEEAKPSADAGAPSEEEGTKEDGGSR